MTKHHTLTGAQRTPRNFIHSNMRAISTLNKYSIMQSMTCNIPRSYSALQRPHGSQFWQNLLPKADRHWQSSGAIKPGLASSGAGTACAR